MSALDAVRHGAYQLHQALYSAWAQRRYAADFARVERFCLFVGYPRSGHSLVGALLNAHRDAVISHELTAPDLILAGCTREVLYGRILARAYWFNLRGNTSNHVYQVPNQWQGRFATLRVIGEKRGGAVSRALAARPDFFARVRALVRVPLRLLHVVRNPFDNIAAISIWERLTLEESVAFYFRMAEITARLREFCDAEELHTLHHEEMIRDPRGSLAALCSFLGLTPEPGYLADCASVVFRAPTGTRRKLDWPPHLVREVERRAATHPDLARYHFAFDDSANVPPLEDAAPLPPARLDGISLAPDRSNDVD